MSGSRVALTARHEQVEVKLDNVPFYLTHQFVRIPKVHFVKLVRKDS